MQITAYGAEHEPAVKQFNARLRASGSDIFFPESHVSEELPRRDGLDIYDEYWLAADDGLVRGGYILKHQPFLIAGEVRPAAHFRLPVSEGYYDKQFASLGIQMFLDAMRKQPLLFTVGLGGQDEAVTKMLVKAGWSLAEVPFYFRVIRPAAFLRNIVYLRTSPFRRAALNLLAASGLGTPAIHGYQRFKTRAARRLVSDYSYAIENEFGGWSDEVWRQASGSYAMIGVRTREILNALYPASEPRWLRLRVTSGGQTVGWAVVLNVPMEGHNFFGNMRVGSLIDCLAVPGKEPQVAAAAFDYLSQHGADIAVCNLSHRAWAPALQAVGFLEGPSNYIFAASKKVASLLAPFDEKKHLVHMTRGDGAGAGNLITARK